MQQFNVEEYVYIIFVRIYSIQHFLYEKTDILVWIFLLFLLVGIFKVVYLVLSDMV